MIRIHVNDDKPWATPGIPDTLRISTTTIDFDPRMTEDDIEFIQGLTEALDKLYAKFYSKPKYLIVDPAQHLSIVRRNYELSQGALNYDSYDNIPLICCDVDSCHLVGDNKERLIKYLKGGGR